MAIRILPLSLDSDDILLGPDTVWDGITGDFAIAADDEGDNAGGLRARAALATAVLLCLMTDRAADPSELRDGEENRGWPGDALSVVDGGAPDVLGSKLWLLRRRSLADGETAQLARHYATEALQPLLDDGVATSIDVTVTTEPTQNRLDLSVTVTDRSGTSAISQTYQILWEQARGLYHPLSV